MGEDEDEVFWLLKRVKRMKGGNRDVSHVKSLALTEYGYLHVSDNIWAKDLSEEEKKFVVSFSTKVRHNEDTSSLNVLQKFKLVIGGNKRGKVARRRIGFNLDQESRDESEDE
eukprot:12019415-Ditylum_brightwellii.AAC.1